ncbi:MAG: glycosyltransferase family 2 protein [Chloroflexota bacterium]
MSARSIIQPQSTAPQPPALSAPPTAPMNGSVLLSAPDAFVSAPDALAVPLFVDVLTRGERRQLLVLVSCWIMGQTIFWVWWLQPGHLTTATGMVVNSLLFFWTTFLPAWYLFFLLRMKQPNPAIPIPGGRVAMIVTKAPAEPWPVVRKTLTAMLQQRFPRPYDVWLADEDPDHETIAWCVEHDVSISCRKWANGYHNASWPGRMKCKEGNLRYFYEAMGGYDRYDFVAQFDADQVPDPDYLLEIIRPFSDPTIGYVAAPSVCDNNAKASWSARGRLYVESSWHGPVQAGYNDGFAPQCIGSHYAVRTRALREIGGLGPELAEDFSTTLIMNAHGWHGAFTLHASTHGDGPACVTDCLTQEYQWSRSIVRVMLLYFPACWALLPMRLKVKFAFCQVWYPLYTLHMVVAYALPIMALMVDSPWVRVHLLQFAFFASLPSLAGIMTIRFTKARGLLRPAYAPVLSWEAALFQFMRWPWMLAGVIDAMVGVLIRKETAFRITPKGEGARPISWRVITPYVSIVIVEAGTVILFRRVLGASGYYLLALLNAVIYTVVSLALPILHFRENRSAVQDRTMYVRFTLRLAPLAAGLIALVAVAFILRVDRVSSTLMPSVPISSRSTPTLVVPLTQTPPEHAVPPVPTLVMPGSTTSTVAPLAPTLPLAPTSPTAPAIPVFTPLPAVMPLDLPTYRIAIGTYDPHRQLADLQLDIEHWYVRQDAPGELTTALASARNQRTPLITIEPFPSPGQAAPVLDTIIAGEKDQDLRHLASILAASKPQVVLVRWGHEMEISGLYPWSANAPEVYRAAYRHVVTVFRSEGVTNVRWIWSPAGHRQAAEFYPGDDVVDYVGLTVLGDEGWDSTTALPPQSFSELLRPRYERVVGFNKPVMIAELGVSGGPMRQAEWLADAARAFPEFPRVSSVVYFYEKNPQTSRVSTQPEWRMPPEILRAFLFAVRHEPAVHP